MKQRRQFNNALCASEQNKNAAGNSFILAKLHYAMHNRVSSHLWAEAFAIKKFKRFCCEKLPLQSTSKQKQLDRENKVIKCYELSGHLTLLYLQVSTEFYLHYFICFILGGR